MKSATAQLTAVLRREVYDILNRGLTATIAREADLIKVQFIHYFGSRLDVDLSIRLDRPWAHKANGLPTPVYTGVLTWWRCSAPKKKYQQSVPVVLHTPAPAPTFFTFRLPLRNGKCRYHTIGPNKDRWSERIYQTEKVGIWELRHAVTREGVSRTADTVILMPGLTKPGASLLTVPIFRGRATSEQLNHLTDQMPTVRPLILAAAETVWKFVQDRPHWRRLNDWVFEFRGFQLQVSWHAELSQIGLDLVGLNKFYPAGRLSTTNLGEFEWSILCLHTQEYQIARLPPAAQALINSLRGQNPDLEQQIIERLADRENATPGQPKKQ